MGEVEPAAEHFLFASLDMPDGTAAQALAAVGQDRASLEVAIRELHIAALAVAGVPQEQAIDSEPIAEPVATSIYRAAPSGQTLMKILAEQARKKDSGGFRSVHVLEAAVALRHGVVPRALKQLGFSGLKVEGFES
jgi:hypothetical protein